MLWAFFFHYVWYRFSLLLLEPGEIYFEDFYVTMKDPKTFNNEETQHFGHLKMCSKSLVFDPKDNLQPIVKIPFIYCQAIEHWDGTLASNDTNVLSITTTQYIEMLEANQLAPYNFKTETRTFLFSFHYARVDEYLSQFCQLHRASSLHACEQNSMVCHRTTFLKFFFPFLNSLNQKHCSFLCSFLFMCVCR